MSEHLVTKSRLRIFPRSLWIYAWTVGITFTVALFIRYTVLESFRVPTSVMLPNLEPGDVILVGKWPYGFRVPFLSTKILESLPRYGEVVTYLPDPEAQVFQIKRVVGLPGDKVGVDKGHLVLNGQPVPFEAENGSQICGKEMHPHVTYRTCLQAPFPMDVADQLVPPGSVFVVGDFRNLKVSRKIGQLVTLEQLEGKALWVWFSVENSENQPTRIRKERLFKKVN